MRRFGGGGAPRAARAAGTWGVEVGLNASSVVLRRCTWTWDVSATRGAACCGCGGELRLVRSLVLGAPQCTQGRDTRMGPCGSGLTDPAGHQFLCLLPRPPRPPRLPRLPRPPRPPRPPRRSSEAVRCCRSGTGAGAPAPASRTVPHACLLLPAIDVGKPPPCSPSFWAAGRCRRGHDSRLVVPPPQLRALRQGPCVPRRGVPLHDH